MRDITLEDTFYHDFTTRQFSDGVPTTLLGTPVLSVLEENNATPITAGVSVSVDRASVAGLNEATIVATAANGYEAGKGYSIYISTGTVGGVSVIGEKVGEFTIEASAAAGRLPGALVGGRIDASVGAMAAAVLNAAAIQTNAITAAKINAAALTASKFAAGAIDANALNADAVAEIARAILPQINTALNNIPFVMVLSSDHISPATGKTVTVTRSLDGGVTWDATTGTVTEMTSGAGMYHFDADAADVNGAAVDLKFSAPDSDDSFVSIRTAA